MPVNGILESGTQGLMIVLYTYSLPLLYSQRVRRVKIGSGEGGGEAGEMWLLHQSSMPVASPRHHTAAPSGIANIVYMGTGGSAKGFHPLRYSGIARGFW